MIFANSVLYAAQDDSIYRLPAGARFSVKVDAEINSGSASVNDTFLATVTRPVKVREVVVLPAGTLIEGRVTSVERSSAASQSGKLGVVFEALKIAGQSRRIEAALVEPLTASSSRAFTFLSIVGGLAAGAAIGAASNASNGALIGAVAGAGAGSGIALLRKGKDVRIRKNVEFEIELKKDVSLPVLDY